MLFRVFVFAFCIVFFQANAQQADESAINKVLQTQVSAWNAGDIIGYMNDGYWQNDSLVFIGKSGATFGFDSTLQRYKRSYPDQEKMGQLSFSALSFRRLSKDYYFVIGQWHLTRKAGNLQGAFSLLFKKMLGKWRIVADHSS
ncbi:MAG: DUF4440 domain-containing protein [Bacteroidetes bacterium]|nr:DUF4440 domain-containing protein [Bacteroidota bacterium]